MSDETLIKNFSDRRFLVLTSNSHPAHSSALGRSIILTSHRQNVLLLATVVLMTKDPVQHFFKSNESDLLVQPILDSLEEQAANADLTRSVSSEVTEK